MKPWQIKKHAEEFGIYLKAACEMRIRYLLQVIDLWPGYIENGGKVPELGEWEAFDQLTAIKQFEARQKRPLREDRITEEMIQAAKDTPIESLITFDRTGKALAFCHADKSPSLSWNRKGNKAHCFPCGKSFNAVDVLIHRDGMTFIDAVKELAR